MSMDDVTAALGDLVLERRDDHRFVRLGHLPSWCGELGLPLDGDSSLTPEQISPYLNVFLAEVDEQSRGGGPQRIDSAFWTAVSKRGEEMHFEASAVRAGDIDFLVIHRNERLFAEQERLLQRARELRLTHEALLQELEQKDVLVHCIVHDLATPLHSVLGALSLLTELPLGEGAAKSARIALQAATRQRELIREILEVFAAEYRSLVSVPDPRAAPDLRKVAVKAISEAEPVARARGVTLSSRMGSAPARVIAEEARLHRVLANLVDNAIHHSPAGGSVVLSSEREHDELRVFVDDDGPGVSRELRPRLFERFATGRERGGSGLGLYFCRITVERWGGAIGYHLRADGGSRFWFRLRAGPGGES
jgi:signal transduction histidine kinase